MARSTSRPAQSRAKDQGQPPALVLHSSSPGGDSPAPGGVDLRGLLQARLAGIDAESGRTFAELIIESWVGSAIGGNFRALQEILDRTQAASGPPPAPASYDDRAALETLEQSVEHDRDIPID